jgi:hypothetical protein
VRVHGVHLSVCLGNETPPDAASSRCAWTTPLTHGRTRVPWTVVLGIVVEYRESVNGSQGSDGFDSAQNMEKAVAIISGAVFLAGAVCMIVDVHEDYGRYKLRLLSQKAVTPLSSDFFDFDTHRFIIHDCACSSLLALLACGCHRLACVGAPHAVCACEPSTYSLAEGQRLPQSPAGAALIRIASSVCCRIDGRPRAS